MHHAGGPRRAGCLASPAHAERKREAHFAWCATSERGEHRTRDGGRAPADGWMVGAVPHVSLFHQSGGMRARNTCHLHHILHINQQPQLRTLTLGMLNKKYNMLCVES